jgi:hypothetical protein
MIAPEYHMWIRRLLICVLLSLGALSAFATPRVFPPEAQRGTMQPGADYSQLVINGQVQLLAPGAQIKSRQNTIVMETSLMNKVYIVNYTIDKQGMVDRVWILTEEEIALTPQ